MDERKQNYCIPMLENGFELLEYISSNPSGVTMKRMVESLSISKTTIFRLLISLTQLGYIYKNDETAEYFLSKKMIRVGLSAMGETNIVEQSLPVMRSLRDQIGESVMLGILINNRVVLLEQVLGLHSFTFLLRTGTSFVTHSSVPGKVFSAFARGEEQQRIIEAIDFKKFNENTITTLEAFEQELREVRTQGYAIELQEEVLGVNCIGVPIFDQFGNITATLWTSGPSGRLSPEVIDSIKDRVIAAGDAISRTLGYDNNSK